MGSGLIAEKLRTLATAGLCAIVLLTGAGEAQPASPQTQLPPNQGTQDRAFVEFGRAFQTERSKRNLVDDPKEALSVFSAVLDRVLAQCPEAHHLVVLYGDLLGAGVAAVLALMSPLSHRHLLTASVTAASSDARSGSSASSKR